MNKTTVKNFAVWARVQLIEAAKQKAYEYEITDGGENKSGIETIGGRVLSKIEKKQRSQLIAEINRKGFTQVMEEAAYTWFNRFIALRFMEVNGYLPSKVRVFTDENGAFKPEILKQAMSVELEGLDRSIVLNLLDRQDNEELFKYLLITQCNALNTGLPYMFEKIGGWTELLFPANLLRSDSVIAKLIADIAIEDWDNEVEIIGWFYQYYISEKHEEVVDPLHGKVVNKEDIPAATQLFTTDWVVRYILDNSLGRYWVERHPESKLAEKLNYFVTQKDSVIPTVNESILPEELKVLDPCVGSGHFLSYAFDILLEIYRECGWSDRDAAKSIIENNLYGLDIDDRAAQLACFAVMMKARKYYRRIFNADTKLHILAMQDSTSITEELIKYVSKQDDSIRNDLNEIRLLFNNAKEYGSIINVPKLDFRSLYARVDEVKGAYTGNLIEMALQRETVELLLPLIQQAEILAGKYDIVATNPPYMNKYSARLKAYIGEHFEAYKGDLFSVFMYRNFAFCKANGYSGFMTPNVWMFIKSYEELRKFIITNKQVTTLVQMAKGAFFKEATVDICAFVLNNKNNKNNKGLYIRLDDFRGDMEVQRQKTLEAIKDPFCRFFFEQTSDSFSKIPGNPLAYWASENFINAYTHKLLSSYGDARSGLQTGDNELFLRLWFEVKHSKIAFNMKTKDQYINTGLKWTPQIKGGSFRKWYGNFDYLVNWENDGSEIRQGKGCRLNAMGNDDLFFREGITWSHTTSSGFGARYLPQGCLFNVEAPTYFVGECNKYYVLGFLNSCVAQYYLNAINATIHYLVGNIMSLPLITDADKYFATENAVEDNIELARKDWDSFETSWDFRKHPLI